MADRLNVPLLSLVENRAYVKCPDCGKRIDIYGKQGNDAELAKKHGIPVFDEIPFDVPRAFVYGEFRASADAEHKTD